MYQKIIWIDIIIVVKAISVELAVLHQKVSKPWTCLKYVIQRIVKIGIIIHKLGLVALSNHFSKIDLNQNIIFKIRRNKAITEKNIDQIIHKNILNSFWLIEAGAANHTQIIEKAKTESIWERLFVFIKSASVFLVINFIK